MWFRKKPKLNNKAEAIELLETDLSKRRNLDYSTLREWIENNKQENYEVKGKSGIDYQLEFSAIWDDKKLRTIRLWGSIDGGDISPSFPAGRSFIKAPDNTFVGE